MIFNRSIAKLQHWPVLVLVFFVLANSEAEISNWQSAPVAVDGSDITGGVIIEDIVVPNGEYRYASFGKPDPFSPPSIQPEVISSEEIPIVSPLQVSLDQLTVAGVWELDDGTKHALIQTEDGQGIIATVDDPIGPSGKVKDITDKGVFTRQYKFRSDGSREFTDMMLKFGYEKKADSSENTTEVISRSSSSENGSATTPDKAAILAKPANSNEEGL